MIFCCVYMTSATFETGLSSIKNGSTATEQRVFTVRFYSLHYIYNNHHIIIFDIIMLNDIPKTFKSLTMHKIRFNCVCAPMRGSA